MDRHLEHALVLLRQHRYDLAEPKLREALAAAPQNALAHALLAHCLCEREAWAEATAEAEQAVSLAPDLPDGYSALGWALLGRNRLAEARRALDEALRLEPGNPDFLYRIAAVELSRRDWAAALAAAELGLASDPEHVGCLNLRGMALVKLGRKDEAAGAIETALSRAPEDAFSHANQGWALLHAGDTEKALEHFREALRLEPGLEFARAGIVEALKARNWIYALFLHYFLLMERLSGGAQWAIVLGGYFGNQALRSLAARNPAWAPWIMPIVVTYVVFALMTWLAAPLFNLLLRFNRFGRHALSADQVTASNWTAAFLGLALVSGGLWLTTGHWAAVFAAGYFGFLLLPVSAVFNCPAGWPRRMMALYTLALAVVGVVWLPLAMLGWGEHVQWAVPAFLWGAVLSGFVANFLAMQRPRH